MTGELSSRPKTNGCDLSEKVTVIPPKKRNGCDLSEKVVCHPRLDPGSRRIEGFVYLNWVNIEWQ